MSERAAQTIGMNHLGLTVSDLGATAAFFADVLGWQETAHDPDYPRKTMTDGVLRLTLWQADQSQDIIAFDRHKNVGLHHLALEVASETKLNELAATVANYNGATVEFTPELMGSGPRKHMMLRDPSGLRIELLWNGVSGD